MGESCSPIPHRDCRRYCIGLASQAAPCDNFVEDGTKSPECVFVGIEVLKSTF